MVQEKMMPHLVWDSPVWALGTVTQRVKLVLWLGSPQRRCELAGTRPSMPQSSEVWGKRGRRSAAREAECRPNFFLPCLTSLGTALWLSRGKAAVLLLQHKEQTGEFRSASQSSERERGERRERASAPSIGLLATAVLQQREREKSRNKS